MRWTHHITNICKKVDQNFHLFLNWQLLRFSHFWHEESKIYIYFWNNNALISYLLIVNGKIGKIENSKIFKPGITRKIMKKSTYFVCKYHLDGLSNSKKILGTLFRHLIWSILPCLKEKGIISECSVFWCIVCSCLET